MLICYFLRVPVPHFQSQAVILGDHLFLFGGFGILIFDDNLFLFGGFDGLFLFYWRFKGESFLNSFHMLNLSTDTWKVINSKSIYNFVLY